jgi:hypothetical protein
MAKLRRSDLIRQFQDTTRDSKSRGERPSSRLDVTAKNLVITEDHAGDDSGLCGWTISRMANKKRTC